MNEIKEKDISLQCIIFRVDFETHFELLDKRGYISSKIKNSERFDEIRFAVDGLSIKCIKNNPYTTIIFSPHNISGRFEGPFLNLDKITKSIKITNNIYNELNISSNDIKRMGARFFFLQEENDINSINQNYLKFFSDKFISAVKDNSISNEDFFDPIFNVKYSNNNFSCRVISGPLDKDKCKSTFEMPQLVDIENSSHVDFDYFITEYKYNDLHLDKFIREAYKEASRVSKSIFLKLEETL